MSESKRSFGEYLLGQGIITDDQLKRAAQEQRRGTERFEQALLRLGMVKEDVVFECLADYFDLPFVDLDTYLMDGSVTKIVPEETARQHTLMPLFKIGNILTIAMADPLNLLALDEIRNKAKIDVEIVISTEKKIKRLIDLQYGAAMTSLQSTLHELAKGQGNTPPPETTDYRKNYDLVEKDLQPEPMGNASASRMVDLVMSQAVRDRASDIHFEPDEEALRIRFRIDGFLYEILTFPKSVHPSLTSQIKVLAKMDITETRLPQDGNFNIKMENRNFEIRVSTCPTIYGENMVLRLLDRSSPLIKLEDLGFTADMLALYRQVLRKPNGILLVTGPTGSGKTTTLYASLNMINSAGKNIITIEDPVEYRLPFIRQTQVNLQAGITFANGLRSILRQGPDVIMVGEIRDLETAEIAIQAALTGHLVLSTLHTNDAAEAVTRLIDMGVEPYLLSSSVIGVLAQRLIRTICPSCRASAPADDEILRELKGILRESKQPPLVYQGQGCDNCKQSGYLGRKGIFEFLILNERIKKLISEKASSPVIREAAKQTTGMLSLREDGLKKVLKGTTTFEEVDRVAFEMTLNV
jgi:type IV pilus assembly protein PilB